MQKSDAVAAGAGARCFVDQADAGLGQPLQGLIDVGHAVSDVVQSGPTAVEKLLDGGIARGRLEQLDTAGPGAHKRDIDLLTLDALDWGTAGLRQEFEKW